MKIIRRLFSVLFCAVAFCVTLALSPAKAQAIPSFEEAVIVADDVNVRLRPTVDSPFVVKLKNGTRIGVFCEEVDGWYRIIYGNYRGYVSKEFVFLPSTDILVGNILNDSTPVYQNAGEFSGEIDTLNAGMGVTITSMLGDYYGIEYVGSAAPPQDVPVSADGGQAGISAEFLSATPEGSVPDDAAQTPGETADAESAGVADNTENADAAAAETADTGGSEEQDLSSAVDTGQDVAMSKGYILKDDVKTSTSKNAANLIKEGMQGVEVLKLQRELASRGFLGSSATGEFAGKTKAAVVLFQEYADLPADGIAGAQTLEMLYGDNDIRITYAQRMGIDGEVHLTPWSEMDGIWPEDSTAKVTDVATGISWTEYRFGGWFHADVVPLTADDTETLRDVVGEWTWERRAVWVTIDGVTYAASMNAMPHLANAIPDNNFGGHHCIHFYKSKVHETSAECPRHQAQVQLAYKRGQFE